VEAFGMMPLSVVLLSVFLAFCAYMLFRNNAVCNERMQLCDKVAALHRAEIHEGVPYDGWRWDHIESVTYYEMLWKFWKPVSSFFPPVEQWKRDDIQTESRRSA
jgi:hypothetical protein